MHRRAYYLRTSLQLQQFNRIVHLRLSQRLSTEQLRRDSERHKPLHRCMLSCLLCVQKKWAALLVHMLLLIDQTTPWNTKSSHVFSFLLTDIDECFEQPGICGLNTVCTNVPGTFFCSCPDGLFPSTGIFWIVGTSFCQSRRRRIWR